MKKTSLIKYLLVYIVISLLYWFIMLQLSLSLNQVILLYIMFSVFSFYRYTQRRYHEIENLADYLRAMNTGNYRLDIEQYTEGDLSILRSELYKTMVELRAKNDQLEDQKNFLNQSLADIAHQLRTPMTSMVLLMEVLEDPDLQSAQRQIFTASLERQIERYRWLVSALLSMSKLDAKVVEFSKVIIYDDDFANQVIYELQSAIEAKNIEIDFTSDHKEIWVDVAWTKEAVINILKNAIDHSPVNGTIEISSQVNVFEWTLTIKDYGTGIDAEDIKFIFKRYYKGKNANKDSIGIGLAMSKMIIAKQKGTLEVQSEVGSYTMFTIKMKKTDVGI